MRADTAVMARMSREDFAVFYQQTAPALRRYLARAAANADLADDLLQEAYIRLIRAAPACETKRRAYLYRTATNLLLDHFRAVRREWAGLRFWKWWQPVESEPRDPVTDVERVFQLLNVRERALLWFAYVEEATHAEIAATIGCGERACVCYCFAPAAEWSVCCGNIIWVAENNNEPPGSRTCNADARSNGRQPGTAA